MADTDTITVRLPSHTKAQLDKLAGHTRRTRSFLAAEAIAAYVERELAIVERIEHGQAELRGGQVTPHDQVMREAGAIIEVARTRR